MLTRLLLYIREMFPLPVYVPYALLSFSGLYFSVQILSGAKRLLITPGTVAAYLTVLSVMLLMRVFDEFKDYDIDRVLFPDRPVARGAVRLSDVRILGFCLVGMMLLLNCMMGWVLLPFFTMLGFAFLTLKWFFMKETISASLVLALVTHQPMTLFVNIYVVAAAMHAVHARQYTADMLLVVLMFFFPVTAWETARKIRTAGKETAYVTYSKLFGPRNATLLPLASLVAAGVLAIVLGVNLCFQPWFFAAAGTLLVAYAVLCLRFMYGPTEKNNIIKPAAEASATLLFLLFAVQLFMKYTVTFQW